MPNRIIDIPDTETTLRPTDAFEGSKNGTGSFKFTWASLRALLLPSDARWFNATFNGVTDDTVNTQAALTAVAENGLLALPATPGITGAKVSSTMLIPRVSGVSIRGSGFRTTTITQTNAAVNVLDSNGTWDTDQNGWLFEDFSLAGGLNGLALNGILRSRLNRLYIRGAALAGIDLKDCFGLVFRDGQIESCQDGIKSTNLGNTGLNATKFSGMTFENHSRYGVYIVNGGSGIGFSNCLFESCHGGGLYLGQDCNGVHVYGGTYFEENTDHASKTQDIIVGDTSYTFGNEINANLFNGRQAGAEYDYVPLRIKFANGLRFHDNYLNVGNRLVTFESGGNILNSRFGPTKFSVDADLSSPNILYSGIPAGFVNEGNSIYEPQVVPLLPGPRLGMDDVYSWDAYSVAGTSTYFRAPGSGSVPMEFRGKPVFALVRGTSFAQVSKAVTISSTHNTEMANRWCTFALPVLTMTNSSSGLNLTVAPNGTGASNAVVNVTGMNLSQGWKVYYVTCWIPADCTSISLIAACQSVETYFLGKPQFYCGVAPLGEHTQPITLNYFASYQGGAPSSGTWDAQDRVWNDAPTSGQPKSSVCTAAGSPGTWVSEGNL